MPLATTLYDVVPIRLRGLSWLALSETGNVLVRSMTDDSGGGQTETFTAGTALPCRVDPMGGGESVTAERIDPRTTHKITVPPSTSVSAADRFEITGRGTFEITAVRKRTQEPVRVLEAIANF